MKLLEDSGLQGGHVLSSLAASTARVRGFVTSARSDSLCSVGNGTYCRLMQVFSEYCAYRMSHAESNRL